MSTLLQFLQKERKLNWKFWFKYYWSNFLNIIYNKKVSNKVDNSWKSIKIANTIFPNNFPKDLKLAYIMNGRKNSEKYEVSDIFKYLEKEYSGTIMKRFKD